MREGSHLNILLLNSRLQLPPALSNGILTSADGGHSASIYAPCIYMNYGLAWDIGRSDGQSVLLSALSLIVGSTILIREKILTF